MAGYMTKLQGYVYEGEMVNGATDPQPNGVLMVLGTGADAGKFVLPSAADTTSEFVCKEVGQIYDGFDAETKTNVPAYWFVVNNLAATYYFVEQNFVIDDTVPFDKTKFTVEVGERTRAHALQIGDQFVTTMVAGTIAVGIAYGVTTNGYIG